MEPILQFIGKKAKAVKSSPSIEPYAVALPVASDGTKTKCQNGSSRLARIHCSHEHHASEPSRDAALLDRLPLLLSLFR